MTHAPVVRVKNSRSVTGRREYKMDEQKKKIAQYYDITLPYYRLFWHRDSESNALHYGFWEEDTKTVKDALINENRFLAELAGITTGTKVLDAGCGIGGSAIWLAKNKGASVVGITLSERQLEKARELAEKHGVSNKTEFYLKDFTNTEFPDDSFDVVWAIESVCHVEDKKVFLREAYRLLKSGGKVMVADGFLWRESQSELEKSIYKDFLAGLVLPNLANVEQFRNDMKLIGFGNVKFLDKTKETEPSSRILYRRVKLFYPIAKFLNFLRIIPDLLIKNSKAGLAQWKLVKSGLGGYGVFYGEK